MNESDQNHQKVTAAVDALLAKKQDGTLQCGVKSNSLPSLLRQRLSDLRTLNEDISASAIATELKAVGCEVSASTIQRLLREPRALKRVRQSTTPTPRLVDAGKSHGNEAVAKPPRQTESQETTSMPADPKSASTNESDDLLKQMQEEDGNTAFLPSKRIASLKSKASEQHANP